jgi:hypothetical protein
MERPLFLNPGNFDVSHWTSWSLALLEKPPYLQLLNKFPKMLWNPKIHHHVHKSPLLVPILRQTNASHTSPSYVSKTHFNIIHPSKSCSSYWLTPSGLPTNILYPFVLHALPILLDLWTSSFCNVVHPHLIPLRSKYPPQHPVLKHPQSMFLP